MRHKYSASLSGAKDTRQSNDADSKAMHQYDDLDFLITYFISSPFASNTARFPCMTRSGKLFAYKEMCSVL